jgi:hypothetical protein
MLRKLLIPKNRPEKRGRGWGYQRVNPFYATAAAALLSFIDFVHWR